jgi:hypothetical protein
MCPTAEHHALVAAHAIPLRCALIFIDLQRMRDVELVHDESEAAECLEEADCWLLAMVCLIRHLVVQHLGRNPILVWRVRSGEVISYIFIGAVGDELLGHELSVIVCLQHLQRLSDLKLCRTA